MYKNLKAEMIRQSVGIEKIAQAIGIRKETAQKKINGKIGISLKECKQVCNLFNNDIDLDYLFEEK